MKIDFNITTPRYDQMRIYNRITLLCKIDFKILWQRNHKKLDSLVLNNVRFIAFHVNGSLDDCQEIKQTGIHNLKYMFSSNTKLSNILAEYFISFDIKNYKLSYSF